MTDFDIAIIGGGLVGTTLAIYLKNSGFKIVLVEAFTPGTHQQSREDMRSIALNYRSREIFKKLNIWPELEIHISEKGTFGNTVLDAKDLSREYENNSFGSVIPIPYLYNTLQDHLANIENIELLRPAKLSGLSQHKDYWELEINQKKYKTTLLIAADGDKSFIRDYLTLPTEKKDYNQTAIVSTLLASKNHHNTAYERFTDQGILALLPLQNNRVACIWTCDNTITEEIKNNFVDITQHSIGYRLGKLSNSATIQTYPIYELIAQTQTLPQFILLGNSAHVLHPVAAQGLNLSLRDVDVLANILLSKKDLKDNSIQQDYIKLRKQDQESTAKMTNRIITLFEPKQFPLPCLRSMGLFTFDLMTPLKNKFCEKAMGL
jgi:2-octaprenyl-6-methoxyphenol hydroxylase